MTIPIDKEQIWLTGRVTKLLTKCYRKGIPDDVIVSVFGGLLGASQASAEAVLEALRQLTESDEDGDEGDVAYA